MASAVSGIAVIFGFKGSIDYKVATVAGLRNLFNQTGEFSDEFTNDMVEDEDNDVRSLIGSRRIYKARLSVIPRAAVGTNTLANAALSLTPPDMLSPVILGAAAGGGANVDFKLALANSSQWVYVGGWKLALKYNGVASFDLDIMRSGAGYDLSAAVS
jgi:hypothetical protein